MSKGNQEESKALVSNPGAGALAIPTGYDWVQEERDAFDRGDLVVPFVRILQDLSPQVKKRDPAYIDGADVGMIFNTATAQLTPGEEGIVIVPVKYQHNVTEWVPRGAGGGFVADHGDNLAILNEARKNEKGTLVLPNGNELVEAALYYALQIEGDLPPSHIVLAMTGFGWRAARNWNTQMSLLKVRGPDGAWLVNPPVFVGAWRLRTQPEQNDKGSFFRWSNPTFECSTFELPNAEQVLHHVKSLRDGLRAGTVRTDVSQSREAPAGDGTGGPRSDDDRPF